MGPTVRGTRTSRKRRDHVFHRKKSQIRIALCFTFRTNEIPKRIDQTKVKAEVPEDGRALEVRRFMKPTSDRLETGLILSGTTRPRHYYDSTMV